MKAPLADCPLRCVSLLECLLRLSRETVAQSIGGLVSIAEAFWCSKDSRGD